MMLLHHIQSEQLCGNVVSFLQRHNVLKLIEKELIFPTQGFRTTEALILP